MPGSDDNSHPAKTWTGRWVLIAAALLSAVLGSVHAFSVFLGPLEAQFGFSRAQISLTYSLALVALTCAVLWGHIAYGRWRPAVLFLLTGALGALGAMLAGAAGSLAGVWLGYSLCFGAANGLGYGFSLQLAAQANPGHGGWAMGVVTAAYALGAMLAPVGFDVALSAGGFSMAMSALAACLIATGGLGALVLHLCRAQYQGSGTAAGSPVPRRPVIRLWLGYGAAVAGGLMAIGHATAIAEDMQYGGAAWNAPAMIAALNLVGSLAAGRMMDSLPSRLVLIALTTLSTTVIGLLALWGGATTVLPGLAIVGFAYGGVIAAIPAEITKRFGAMDGPRIYGRVFTAWGCAGLTAPWVAGRVFDRSGDYRMALLMAAAISALSVVALWTYSRGNDRR